MADPSRAATSPVASPSRAAERDGLLALAERAPYAFSFFQLLRRVQNLSNELPRLGEAERPLAEPLRFGQEPSLAFAPAEIASLDPSADGGPTRVLVSFFGMLGPNGALPLHLTEHARDRLRNADDPTMSRFLDVFHHRMVLFMFRAWAAGQPTVDGDRPDGRFSAYVGALEGLGLAALRDGDALPDAAKLFYAGRLGAMGRNAEGLAAIIGDFFGVPTRIESFVRDWLELPSVSRWRLGQGNGVGRLGLSSPLGERVPSRQGKFRVVIGPLHQEQFQRLLPGGESLPRLTAMVRGYVGDHMSWDVRLFLAEEVDEPWLLGRTRLAWASWLGRERRSGRRADLILDPQREERRVAGAETTA